MKIPLKVQENHRSGFAEIGRFLPYIILGIAILARLVPGPRTIDDAFITFRYARHILSGSGFSFNPGEHVLGTTTPFYTLLMVIFGSISGGSQAPFPIIAWLLNTAADAASCFFLWKIAEQLGSRRVAIAVSLVWAVAPFSVTFAIGGMETSVIILLLISSVWAYLNERTILWAVLSGLAFLTRPDALILIGLFALDRLVHTVKNKTWPSLIKEGLVFILVVSPWLIFATLYFGSPLPNSIAAKTAAYHLSPDAGLIRLLQHYATPFMEHNTFGSAAVAVNLFLCPFLAAVGSIRAFRKNSHSWASSVYPWVYLLIFAVANPLLFRWYLSPPLPFYFLAILFGLEQILEKVGDKIVRSKPVGRQGSWAKRAQVVIAIVIVFLPALSSLSEWGLHPDHGLDRPAPDMAWYKLELLYRDVADRIVASVRPQDVVAAGDVGVLGYFTEANILDTVGLNSPQTIGYYPLDSDSYVINYAIPAQLILDYRPRFVVFLEVYGRETLLKNDQFLSAYTLFQKIPTDIYGSEGMLIFELKTGQ